MTRRIVALAATLAVAMFAAPIRSSAQVYPSNQYGQSSISYTDVVSGRISTSQPYNVWLNGVHVMLHDDTIITPRGATLLPGLRVNIFGDWNADGTFEANQIDVVPQRPAYAPAPSTYGPTPCTYAQLPYATVTYYRQSPSYSARPDYLAGTVSSFEPYNMSMSRGGDNLHVALHDGTVINPTGITLEAGMRVRVWGHWNSDGTFEANQIDVVNAADFGY